MYLIIIFIKNKAYIPVRIEAKYKKELEEAEKRKKK
jgi:hypothetical protein